MKTFFQITILFTLLLSTLACSQKKNGTGDPSSIVPTIDAKPIVSGSNNTATLNLNKQILSVLKAKDYAKLSEYISPTSGLILSPYGIVDTVQNIKLSKATIATMVNDKATMLWGKYEGSGEPIQLTANDYFAKFVYAADYANADSTNYNKMVAPSNTSSNVATIYTNNSYTESYIAGKDANMQGKDWSSLVLVYKVENGNTYLAGIVHNQWKP